MEILFLEPAFKDYMWGGNRLKNEFNKNTPYEITAESWEVSTNKNGKSITIERKLTDESLSVLKENEDFIFYFENKYQELIKEDIEEIFNKCTLEKIVLLED